jgi:hypothetical protein
LCSKCEWMALRFEMIWFLGIFNFASFEFCFLHASPLNIRDHYSPERSSKLTHSTDYNIMHFATLTVQWFYSRWFTDSKSWTVNPIFLFILRGNVWTFWKYASAIFGAEEISFFSCRPTQFVEMTVKNEGIVVKDRCFGFSWRTKSEPKAQMNWKYREYSLNPHFAFTLDEGLRETSWPLNNQSFSKKLTGFDLHYIFHVQPDLSRRWTLTVCFEHLLFCLWSTEFETIPAIVWVRDNSEEYQATAWYLRTRDWWMM